MKCNAGEVTISQEMKFMLSFPHTVRRKMLKTPQVSHALQYVCSRRSKLRCSFTETLFF